MDDIDWESWGLIQPRIGLDNGDPTPHDIQARHNPDRAALRGEIVTRFLDPVLPAADNPRLFILGGGSGSGKTTLLAFLRRRGDIPMTGRCVDINPDEIKACIPEYQTLRQKGDARAADVVHEESSRVRGLLMAAALAKGVDIVLDVTMANRARGLKAIGDAIGDGYQIALFGATIGAELAVYRVVRRGLSTGRHVPISSVLSSHKGFS